MLSDFKVVARLIQKDLLSSRHPWNFCNHSFIRFASHIYDYNQTQIADMGKEKGKDKIQFQLKTPKGTKDCEKFIYPSVPIM